MKCNIYRCYFHPYFYLYLVSDEMTTCWLMLEDLLDSFLDAVQVNSLETRQLSVAQNRNQEKCSNPGNVIAKIISRPREGENLLTLFPRKLLLGVHSSFFQNILPTKSEETEVTQVSPSKCCDPTPQHCHNARHDADLHRVQVSHRGPVHHEGGRQPRPP